uniref:Uncharacterized protein n=1 Tax=Triticum urartu TaxID=4572 RepID=A0A8R7QG79_TRIUA
MAALQGPLLGGGSVSPDVSSPLGIAVALLALAGVLLLLLGPGAEPAADRGRSSRVSGARESRHDGVRRGCGGRGRRAVLGGGRHGAAGGRARGGRGRGGGAVPGHGATDVERPRRRHVHRGELNGWEHSSPP